MASPAVVGTPAETAIVTASTTHVVNLPSGAVGNQFVAVLSKGSAGTTPSVDALAGWTEVLDEAIVLGLFVAVRVCDGTEGATTTFTLSSATRGAWIVYEISGAENPATQAPQVGTTATGSSTTPDPPSVSVAGGAKDILTIALFGRAGEEADDDTWTTAAPSGFGTLLQKACGTAGTNLAGMVSTAHLAANTATSDPGTFTCATGAWRAQTVVIHPAAIVDADAEVAWAEVEVPTAQSAAEVSWAELEVPIANSDAEVSWAEFEVPTADSAAEASFAELEVPDDLVDADAEVSWAELEAPLPDAAAEVSWAEFEVPTADSAAEVSWAEFEVPTADSEADVSFAEVEVPTANAAAEVSWAELQVPNVGGEGGPLVGVCSQPAIIC